MNTWLYWLAVTLLFGASLGLLIARDWRWLLGWLAALYLGCFALTNAHWPITMSAVKLVTGWMAAAALGITQSSLESKGWKLPWPDQGRKFRLAAGGMVAMIMLQAAFALDNWLPAVGFPVTLGSLLLLGGGLLQLGMTSDPLRVTLGLLTTLAGFEILYAAVENSVLVTGLLTIVTLGLALAGSYLLLMQAAPERPE